MKTRILNSLNRNAVLGIVALSSLTFTSCSRSLADLQNSKQMQNQEVLVNPSVKPEKQIAAMPQIANPVPAIVVQPNSGLTASALPRINNRNVAPVRRTSVLASKMAFVKTQLLNKVENQVAGVQNLTKSRNEASFKRHSQFGFGMVHRGIVLIIVGLILIVLAVLLPWPLNNLFYIIGAIFLVVGILDLLFGLMRGM